MNVKFSEDLRRKSERDQIQRDGMGGEGREGEFVLPIVWKITIDDS